MYLNFLYVGALGVLILLFLGGLVTYVMFIPYVAVPSLGGSRGFSTWCVACSVG